MKRFSPVWPSSFGICITSFSTLMFIPSTGPAGMEKSPNIGSKRNIRWINQPTPLGPCRLWYFPQPIHANRCWPAWRKERTTMKTDRTEVLVVGAGPVGLLTAILLAEAGIKVEIIDREDRPAARSYACALHSPTIQLLDRLGLAEPLMAQGRPIHGIAFYDGDTRCAEIKLSALGGKFPFLLVLPQSSLEEILEQRLLRSAGVRVKWNHRFAKVEPEDEDVVATVEKLGGTALGYIVPHWETVVQKEISIRAKF